VERRIIQSSLPTPSGFCQGVRTGSIPPLPGHQEQLLLSSNNCLMLERSAA
jgi:hypothetical protein